MHKALPAPEVTVEPGATVIVQTPPFARTIPDAHALACDVFIVVPDGRPGEGEETELIVTLPPELFVMTIALVAPLPSPESARFDGLAESAALGVAELENAVGPVPLELAAATVNV